MAIQPVQRGDDSDYKFNIDKTFFPRTPGTISTKLGTKHPWIKEIQDCLNKGPHPIPRGGGCGLWGGNNNS